MSLSSVVEDLKETSSRLAEPAARALQPLATAIAQGKNLAKSLFPVMLEEEGLVWALKNLAETTTAVSRVPCTFEGAMPVLLADNVIATHLYRIAQEAISNAVRHAQPTVIGITLEEREQGILLTVQDDGIGIKMASRDAGMGLRIMRFRASAIGADLDITHLAEGGTRVEVVIPIS